MTDQKANIADELLASLEEGIQILEGALAPTRIWTPPATVSVCQNTSAGEATRAAAWPGHHGK
jgi:putative transcriptional regulator